MLLYGFDTILQHLTKSIGVTNPQMSGTEQWKGYIFDNHLDS